MCFKGSQEFTATLKVYISFTEEDNTVYTMKRRSTHQPSEPRKRKLQVGTTTRPSPPSDRNGRQAISSAGEDVEEPGLSHALRGV